MATTSGSHAPNPSVLATVVVVFYIFLLASVCGLQVFTYQGGIDSARSVVNRKSVGEAPDELICLKLCQEATELACDAIQFKPGDHECILLETKNNGNLLEKGPDYTIHASGFKETAPGPAMPACPDGEDKYFVMTLIDSTTVGVGLYSANDWKLCKRLPTLNIPIAPRMFQESFQQLFSVFSEARFSVLVNNDGLWELQLSQSGSEEWQKLGVTGPGRLVLKKDEEEETLFSFNSLGISTFDFETGQWKPKIGQALVAGNKTYTISPFQATADLAVIPFLGPGYAVYNMSSEKVVVQAREITYRKDVNKTLFFKIPLGCGGDRKRRGLAMAQNMLKNTQGRQQHGALYYLDFDWLEKGIYTPIKMLNTNGLPDDFKKNGLGRVLTGHPDGPVLYNARKNTLTYWSTKTNSFSGLTIPSPFNSSMAQGFYHPKLANITSDVIPFEKSKRRKQRDKEEELICPARNGIEKFLILTLDKKDLKTVGVALYTMEDDFNFELWRRLPSLKLSLSVGQYMLEQSAHQLMTEVSVKRRSVLVLERGQLYELRFNNNNLKWKKLGKANQLPSKGKTHPIIYEPGVEVDNPTVTLFGFAEDKAAVYRFDFVTLQWSKVPGPSFNRLVRSYPVVSFFVFKASDNLAVIPFMGEGYAVYNMAKEKIVYDQKAPGYKFKWRTNLYFEFPLANNRGNGLALAQGHSGKHGSLFHLDYAPIREGKRAPITLLNRQGLPENFKKNGLGRVLTGHPDGPILYNTRDNSLRRWSKETNAFSGAKTLKSPFASKMAQGFYHPMFDNID